MTDLFSLQNEALAQVATAPTLQALDDVRVAMLGKKGKITELLKTLGSASPQERKTLGAAINAAKDAIAEAIEGRQKTLNDAAITARLASETVDITLPVRAESKGKVHPVSQVIEEITAIFADLGFFVAEGPDVEDDYNNFTALNIPESHPARQMHDTFYLKGSGIGSQVSGKENAETRDLKPETLLRTHTSPVQIRTMKAGKPPFRFIAPGSTYRCDSDMTHTPMFHQVEGLVIEKDITFAHLKGCVENFLKAFFEISDVPVRFRPSFFPFTEPSAEVDIGCSRDKGELKIGAGKDWLEVMGCGMVHPNVLKNCGIDPNEWQGFAFGMGVERLAMLKYGIPDLRTFFDSDIRWLEHYGFDALDIPTIAAGLTK